MDIFKWEILQFGDCVQQLAHSELKSHKIFKILSSYKPILVGTIPISLYTAESDLDIVCMVEDLNSFATFLKEEFSHFPYFNIVLENIRNEPSITCEFELTHFKVEIFGQNVEPRSQHAYLHMVKEYEIMEILGIEFKEKVLELKRSGVKTEPAFAQLLNMEGDSYIALLDFDISKLNNDDH